MKKFITVLICVVLSFHLLSCSQIGGNTQDDIKGASFEITYSARLTYNNSVGSDWERGLQHNGETISSGSRITQETKDKLSLTAFAIEYDSWNDKGSTNVTFDGLEIGKKKSQQVTVVVRENKGRYKGNIAKWTFDITVERIS